MGKGVMHVDNGHCLTNGWIGVFENGNSLHSILFQSSPTFTLYCNEWN
jgi:hypothetical protein